MVLQQYLDIGGCLSRYRRVGKHGGVCVLAHSLPWSWGAVLDHPGRDHDSRASTYRPVVRADAVVRVGGYVPGHYPAADRFPFCRVHLQAVFDGIPRDYEEAALMDGAHRLRVYWQIL